jgi:Arc/MetJ-type ribon-helix-helix transcriptional regulator
MNDVMVTIRMPKSLADELRGLTKKRHFMDLSEEVRSIVRRNWLECTNPELSLIKKLREEIENEIKSSSKKKIQHEVAKELEKIRAQLKKEGFVNER